MAQSYKHPGEVLTLTAPYEVDAGEGALVGSIFGVACDDTLNGAEGEFMTEGVHELDKTSAQEWVAGDKVYWNVSTKLCDNDGTTGMLIGYATEAAANPTSTGLVKLNGSAPSSSEGPQAAEADLSGTLTGTANGSLADIAATAAACAGGAEPSAAQVDTAIALAVSTIVSGTNEQLKELQTKLNATLAKLRIAGIIAS
jgi:predicted RecA/RadA family phage recombinase